MPKDGAVGGEVLVNGVAVGGNQMKRISGFVFQDDVLFDTMTVSEAVSMSARLRLPDSISAKSKQDRIEGIIKLLGLEAARNTQIGTPEKKGISGGERKRTAIAMEMVTDPQVLFLDEPTSGLDTFTAFSVVSQLKELAQAGRTVVATIHQPSSKTFLLFDDLLLLAEGRVVYHGPVNGILEYLAEQGHVCPAYMNPADFIFMEVLNTHKDDEERNPVKVMEEGAPVNEKNAALIKAWGFNEANRLLIETISSIHRSSNPESLATLAASEKVQSSFSTQFSFLTARVARNMVRNRMVLMARVIRAVAMGVLLSAIFRGLDEKTGYAQTQDRVSALFFICTNEFFFGVGNSLMLFTAERGVFMREYGNGYYGLLPYVLSKSMLDIPQGLVSPFVTVSIMYYTLGLKAEWIAYFTTVFTAQLIALVGSSLGLSLGGIFPDFQMAMSLMPAITMPMMIFGGVQINLASIPWYFCWLPYVSPIRWAFSALAQNELRGLIFKDCSPGVPCSGDDVLRIFSLDKDPSILQNWLVLATMFGIYTLLSFFFLYRCSRK